jgi:hypothetical protein
MTIQTVKRMQREKRAIMGEVSMLGWDIGRGLSGGETPGLGGKDGWSFLQIHFHRFSFSSKRDG